MTKGLRRRVFILQVGLIGILAFVAAFAFGASSFASNQVHDNLAAQQIYFPAAGSPALTALPAADAAAMTVFAGQQLTTGTPGGDVRRPLHRRAPPRDRRRPDVLAGERRLAGGAQQHQARWRGADALPW